MSSCLAVAIHRDVCKGDACSELGRTEGKAWKSICDARPAPASVSFAQKSCMLLNVNERICLWRTSNMALTFSYFIELTGWPSLPLPIRFEWAPCHGHTLWPLFLIWSVSNNGDWIGKLVLVSVVMVVFIDGCGCTGCGGLTSLKIGCFILNLWRSDAFQAEGEKLQSNGFVSKLPGWRPMLLPLQILLKPFQKRFIFHFYGNKKTNNLDKVRCLTQLDLIPFNAIQIIQERICLKWRTSNHGVMNWSIMTGKIIVRCWSTKMF